MPVLLGALGASVGTDPFFAAEMPADCSLRAQSAPSGQAGSASSSDGDHIGDEVGGAVYGAGGAEAAGDFGEIGFHGGADVRGCEQVLDFAGDFCGLEGVLDEFGDGAFFGDEVDHGDVRG